MELVVSGLSGKRLVLTDFEIDMEFGAGTENDFELSGVDYRLTHGELVWCPGTEWGGVIDDDEPKHTSTGDTITYHGRTWHGVLAGNVVHPDSGKANVTVSGDGNEVISALLSRCSVGEPFAVSTEAAGTVPSTTLPRYGDLYSGICEALSAGGMRLAMSCVEGTVTLSAVTAKDCGDCGVNTYDVTRNYRPVNHLTVLGKGEGAAREVLELYADEEGNVSTTQSLFGLDHRGEVYELSNQSGDELAGKGRSKLAGYQTARNTIKASLPESAEAGIGDTVTIVSAKYGVRTSIPVTGIVVSAGGGTVSVSPQAGGEFDSDGYE